MRKTVGMLMIATASLALSGCLEIVDGSDGSYSMDGFYVDPSGSWFAPYSDSYYYETEYYTDEWDEASYGAEAGFWLEDDGWYYDEYYDEWYYYDEYYDEWYYYDEYYDEWYYYDEYYDEWYYYDEYYGEWFFDDYA